MLHRRRLLAVDDLKNTADAVYSTVFFVDGCNLVAGENFLVPVGTGIALFSSTRDAALGHSGSADGAATGLSNNAFWLVVTPLFDKDLQKPYMQSLLDAPLSARNYCPPPAVSGGSWFEVSI